MFIVTGSAEKGVPCLSAHRRTLMGNNLTARVVERLCEAAFVFLSIENDIDGMKTMVNKVVCRQGDASDLPGVQQLLRESDLPYADVVTSGAVFLLATYEEEMIGCIGLEGQGPNRLLRSFAVKQNFRNTGIGKVLIDELKKRAFDDGVVYLHLLTTTAEKYFAREGFVAASRDEAPDEIKRNAEFAGLCPASSTYMYTHLRQ